MIKEYVLYSEYQGELARSESLLDIYHMSLEEKEINKKYHMGDKFYFMKEISKLKDSSSYIKTYEVEKYDVKIYKRGNKIYCKNI